jgi:hypothetical protein
MNEAHPAQWLQYKQIKYDLQQQTKDMTTLKMQICLLTWTTYKQETISYFIFSPTLYTLLDIQFCSFSSVSRSPKQRYSSLLDTVTVQLQAVRK